MADPICTVRRAGGSLVVRLLTDNLVGAGGHFLLNTNDDQVVEEWEMQPGAPGSADHSLVTPTAALTGHYLQWRIRVCSLHPSVDSARVTVQVLQDGAECPIVPERTYNLRAIPQCKSGAATVINDFADLELQ